MRPRDAAFRTGTVPLKLGEDDTLLGWHAILLVGYRDDPETPGGGYFLFQNSWGEDWASASPHRAGVGSVPYAYFEENETETHYLEPADPSSAKVVAGSAFRFVALTAIVGLIAFCGLFLQSGWLVPVQAPDASGVQPSQIQGQPQIPHIAAVLTKASFPGAGITDTWETLDAEHQALDHDLSKYVRKVRQKFPEMHGVVSKEQQ